MVTCSDIVPAAISRSSCATPGAGTADRPIATRAPFVQLSIITAYRTWQDMRRLARLSSSRQARPSVPAGEFENVISTSHSGRPEIASPLRKIGGQPGQFRAPQHRQRGAGARSFSIRYRPLSLRWQFGRRTGAPARPTADPSGSRSSLMFAETLEAVQASPSKRTAYVRFVLAALAVIVSSRRSGLHAGAAGRIASSPISTPSTSSRSTSGAAISTKSIISMRC